MYLVYPTEWWSTIPHRLLIVDDQDRLQYAAREIYDCAKWLVDHGHREFLAPRAGALQVHYFEVEGPLTKGAKWLYGGVKPGSDDVARAFLQRFGQARLAKIVRWWNPWHAWISFDTAPGAAPEPMGGDPVEVAEKWARQVRAKPEAMH